MIAKIITQIIDKIIVRIIGDEEVISTIDYLETDYLETDYF